MRETPWRILRRTVLGLVACAMALTWAQSGRTQTLGCDVVRGQDPLDVLQVQVKHNVWFILDGSGSMSNPFPGSSVRRVEEAVDVIENLLDTFVDASNQPLVNWGFRYFLCNDRSSGGICSNASFVGNTGSNQCSDQFVSTCGGLIADPIEPPACQEPDKIEDIKDRLSIVENNNRGLTPNGISLDQLSTQLANNFVDTLLPGQKNFIVLLTDGWDTCECATSVWDGNSSPMLREDSLDPTPGLPVPVPPGNDSGDCDGDGNTGEIRPNEEAMVRAYNAGLKASDAFLRLNEGVATAGLGDIWVVGMGLGAEACFTQTESQGLINHLAWEASGASVGNPGAHGALFASNREELEERLLDVLSNIAVPTTEVTLGSPIVASVKELMHLTDATDVSQPADFLAAGGADLDVINQRNQLRNNILFTTSVELPGWRGHFRANNIFQVAADGTRTQDLSGPVWDAGERLQARDPDDRQIFFNRPVPVGTVPPAPLSFDTATVLPVDLDVQASFLSDLDPTGVGAATAADAAAIVVGVVRGKRLVVSSSTGFYDSGGNLNLVEVDALGENTWKLYDITSAPAVVLAPPRSATVDPPNPAPEYRDFFNDHINRQTIAYVSSNGGMVHAFRADSGHELYGYIPHDVLPRLQDFVRKVVSNSNGIANHEFFMATSPTVADAFLQPSVNGISEWRTVISVGRGRGGKFVSAIDVTDVGDWDGQSADLDLPDGFQPPRLMFTVGNNDGAVDQDASGIAENNYDGMGETWSLPAMGRVRAANVEGQWVVFFGGGYGCENSEEGKFFYVLRLEDGNIYAKLGPIQDVVGASDPGIDENALVASPALFNPHEPGVNDGLDFITRAYIGDLQGFVYKLVSEDPDPANWVFDVLFEVTSEADQAAGQGEHNQPITAKAALIKLSTSPSVLVFVGTGGDQRVELQEPDRFKMVGIIDDGSFDGQLFVTSNGPAFFDLPEGERVTAAPVAARNSSTDGVVFFASSRLVLDLDLCAGGFTSTLTALAVTGGLGAFDMDPSLAGVQGQVDLGEGKVTGLYHRDEHLYVSMSGGIGFPSETRVYGSETFPTPPVGSSNLQLLVDTFRMSPF